MHSSGSFPRSKPSQWTVDLNKILGRLGEHYSHSLPRSRSGVVTCGRGAGIAVRLAWTLLLTYTVAALAHPLPLQEQQSGAPMQAGPLTTIHGVVKNAVTGEPLPRALVRIEGDATAGALTDGDGRFEISGVPVGPQAIQLQKPGYKDAGPIDSLQFTGKEFTSEHAVHIVADMPDLVFAMAPTNSIRGQVQLSSGDPGQNISVMLLRRAVQDGRAAWQIAANAKTNSDGIYRFAGLTDGAYAVYTDPAMDSESATFLVEAGSDGHVARYGYPSTFYPDARDLSGAAKIQLAGGQQAQANLSLTLEPFYMVRATVVPPGGAIQKGAATNYSVNILDPQGHLLPYNTRGEETAGSFQAMLPDGTYSFLANANATGTTVRIIGHRGTGAGFVAPGPMAGQVDFSVTGHAVTNLRIPLAPQVANPVQVSVMRNSQSSAANNQGQAIFLTLSQAGGWITDGMISTYAEGSVGAPLQTNFMGPGAYWVHTGIAQKSLCEASFTSGGASLAREPLLVGASGATAPLTLTLRDDCATLRLALPGNVAASVAGEEPSYTVYVVPDFDSTVDVTPVTLRMSSGGTFNVEGLTPGGYHVYTFESQVDLEYRNAAAMAALPNLGQAVTLSPGATSDLVVEVPAK